MRKIRGRLKRVRRQGAPTSIRSRDSHRPTSDIRPRRRCSQPLLVGTFARQSRPPSRCPRERRAQSDQPRSFRDSDRQLPAGDQALLASSRPLGTVFPGAIAGQRHLRLPRAGLRRAARGENRSASSRRYSAPAGAEKSRTLFRGECRLGPIERSRYRLGVWIKHRRRLGLMTWKKV